MRIAIVGAGIMGRMLAWHLLRAGLRPELYDRDPIDSGTAAAYTAAGMLAPCSELESSEDLIYRMGLQSLALWRGLTDELGADIGFHEHGTLVVAHGQDRADLRRFSLAVAARLGDGAERGGPRELDAAGVAGLEPELAERFREALYLPGEGWVDNRRVLAVLAARLREAGLPWHAETPVDRVAAGRIESGGSERRFDWVVDCRGLGAKADLPGLRGVRGELLQVAAPGVNIRHMVRLMHPRYRLYLVPGAEDRYIIGATQIESEDMSPLSVRSAMELLSALYTLHRDFAEARILDSRSNCRPALSDNLPRVDSEPGLVRINGLFRHGFLLAPLLAREVAGHLRDPRGHRPAWPAVFETKETMEY